MQCFISIDGQCLRENFKYGNFWTYRKSPEEESLHPWVKVDQAVRSLKPNRLSIVKA